MTHQEYLEKYGEDGYTRFLDRNDAANPERLDEQVALGRLAAFAPPQGDRRTSEALFWCPHIEKYPWWTATIRWAEDPTPKLPPPPDLGRDVRLPRGFEVPAYTFVQVGSGAHAALWANIWHKTYGGSYYWLTDPKVIWGASAPWEAERFTKKKNRES